MSGLLRNPVNPLNNVSGAVVAETQVDTATGEIISSADPVVETSQQTAVATAHPSAVAAVAPTTQMLPITDNDGFDDLDLGFGAFPRVKLEAGKFWVGSEIYGDKLIAHIAKIQKVYVIRDRADQNDKGGRAIWSYDGTYTTTGESVEAVKAKWASEGFTAPVVRETGEAVALLKDGKLAGKVVMLSIPQQSMNKLAGYHKELQLTRGKRVSEVLTEVAVGDPVKAGSGTFTPWNFNYFGALETH